MYFGNAKIEALKILQEDTWKPWAVSVMSASFSIFAYVASVFFLYTLTQIGRESSQNFPRTIGLYILFTIAFFCALYLRSVIACNKKRWFAQNAISPIRIRAWFSRTALRIRMQYFFLFLLKRVFVFCTFFLFELPATLVLFSIYFAFQNGGIYESVLYLLLAFCFALFCVGLYFTGVTAQKYMLLELLLLKGKKMTVLDALHQSKALTDGLRFHIFHFKLSFCLWAILLVFLVVAPYVFPYINQSYGTLTNALMGETLKNTSSFDKKPIVFQLKASA